MTPTDTGKHFPERIENVIHGGSHCSETPFAKICAEHLSFGRRVFAIGFDMQREITVMFRIREAVMPF
jgi:hypothetical protein